VLVRQQECSWAWVNMQFYLTMQAKATGLEVLVYRLVPSTAAPQKYQLDRRLTHYSDLRVKHKPRMLKL
jgi:hypothetical protein